MPRAQSGLQICVWLKKVTIRRFKIIKISQISLSIPYLFKNFNIFRFPGTVDNLKETCEWRSIRCPEKISKHIEGHLGRGG